jgi:hypothetical protein
MLDVQTEVGSAADDLESFLDRQDSLSLIGFLTPLSHVKFLELIESLILEPAARAGGAAEPLIMENHHVTVLAELAIQLDRVGARFNGLFEGKTGVFRKIPGGTPVSYFDEGGHMRLGNHGCRVNGIED